MIVYKPFRIYFLIVLLQEVKQGRRAGNLFQTAPPQGFTNEPTTTGEGPSNQTTVSVPISRSGG